MEVDGMSPWKTSCLCEHEGVHLHFHVFCVRQSVRLDVNLHLRGSDIGPQNSRFQTQHERIVLDLSRRYPVATTNSLSHVVGLLQGPLKLATKVLGRGWTVAEL